MMRVLTLFFLANQALCIFGEVIILRGPTYYNKRKLICISEDDGGALVWNTNLIWEYPSYAFNDRRNDLRFSGINTFSNEVDCNMNIQDRCLALWSKDNWNFTNSLKTPMGPVSDQRWEEFKEFEKFDSKYDPADLEVDAAKLSFSVRTITDAHILLCNGTNYFSNFCYWIIIGGWENTKSIIRKCPSGVPPPKKFPDSNSDCGKEQVFFKHNPLSANEWRSFVITWDSATHNITLYDNNSLFMTYVDTENFDLAVKYNVFIRSPKPMLFRFHIYNFFYTTDENAVLSSPKFLLNNKAICIRLLIGLCTECDADVVIRDSTHNNILETITAKGSLVAMIHDLPMWQSVTIKKNLSTAGSIIIQLIPKLNAPISSPLWAIANVRQCSLNSMDFRRGILDNYQDYSYNYFWPNVTCQKLFYNENTVVSSKQDIDSKMKPDLKICPEGYIAPNCLISCSQLDSNSSCMETAVCYKNGCTCAPGFFGSQCSESCKLNTYGYNCEKTCGSCLYSCNKVTGKCPFECDNKLTTIYIPPLCQIEINKPKIPVITDRSATTIRAIAPVTWKEEYGESEIYYFFSIKNKNGEITQKQMNRLFPNMTSLIGYFEDLQSGTFYEIKYSLFLYYLYMKRIGEHVDSDWQSAETTCIEAESFMVTPEETSLTIDIQVDTQRPYLCPANWYRMLVKHVNTSEQLVNRLATGFSYKLSYLASYESYKVTISHRNEIIFSKEIRTLEDVPSKVLDLRKMLTLNTLTLLWNPPAQPNGEILRYQVTVKVARYYGCQDLKLPTPENHIITEITTDTTITIPELHPYTGYSVQVTAHNSRHKSEAARMAFRTDISEIPAAKFSQLRIQGWELMWNPPEDCTTILGPIFSKIKIRGISDAVKDSNETKKTALYHIDLSKVLYGAEQYEASIYAIRDYKSPENASANQTLVFETPPKAPPKVTNLDVAEIDTRTSPALIHLRWQRPLAPLNGVLSAYTVVLCIGNNYCKRIEVALNDCDLWDNYVCKIVEQYPKIHVEAKNINVSEASLQASVTDEMLRILKPDAPGNCTFTINNNSVVDLKWLHPWRTANHLQYFYIVVETVSSNLTKRVARSSTIERNYNVTNYMRNYSERLYLLPSTKYVISIQAVTIDNRYGGIKSEEIWTPSTINFSGDLGLMAHESDSTISLNIPRILNDTRDSVMHIIIKGLLLDSCEQHSKLPANLMEQANIKMYDIAWMAAKIPTSEFAGKVFTIGDNRIYGGATNCPLKSGELYEVLVIITEQNSIREPITLTKRASIRIGEVPPRHYEIWLIPIILFIVVAAAAFYFYRRRKQKLIEQLMLQDEIVLSQNIENNEQDAKSVISNSKQGFSTPSDRQSLSRVTTPEALPITADNNEEEKEMTSLAKVKDFEDYVRQAIKSGLLDRQYETFQRGQTRPWDYGKLPQNKSKNRYSNLVAYDETRVILKKFPDDAYSDYINANYITGYKKEKRYIATQGPKPNTVVDFWRMIWQEKVLIICMLANVIENGKTKCEQYWPDIGKKKKYGDIIVLNAKHNVFADYCFRTLHVTYGGETRKVEHLHYTAWPDHGVPLYTNSVVKYLKKLLATPLEDGPVVVHCSAGVGIAGTIVLCDICLHRAAAEGVMDVFAETASIRHERANMVDNKEQYLFAHLTLVECLLSISTTLPCNETLPMRINELKKQLPVQQQRLQNTAWQDEALRQVTSPPPLSENNRSKNRFPELISASDEDSDYLSAVYVDGVRLQNQYLATQLPMPSTINDFWRMVAEFKVELILMLQPPDLKDPTCCAIAPVSGEFKPTPFLNITAKETVELEYYTSQKFLLVDNSEKPSKEQSVTILCFTEWKPGRNQSPPPVMTMVTLWQAAERIARGDGPTVTLCQDGVTGCGLYLALSFLLERMAVERECDVCLAVRAVRRSRPDFVRSLEHLEYLYDAAIAYLEYFETYANFS